MWRSGEARQRPTEFRCAQYHQQKPSCTSLIVPPSHTATHHITPHLFTFTHHNLSNTTSHSKDQMKSLTALLPPLASQSYVPLPTHSHSPACRTSPLPLTSLSYLPTPTHQPVVPPPLPLTSLSYLPPAARISLRYFFFTLARTPVDR